jgi:hypothetical protein
MQDSFTMRERIAFLKAQAHAFRRLGDGTRDMELKSRFVDLAERCDQIAANIETNLSIHERSRQLRSV